MKKFTFTFQTLLDIQNSLEREQKNQLAVVNRTLQELQDTKNALLKKVFKTQDLYKIQLAVDALINSNNYLVYLKQKLVDINIKISLKENEKQQVQNQLMETMIQRKTYEKLREKQLEAYKKELALEDEKALNDFIASNGGE